MNATSTSGRRGRRSTVGLLLVAIGIALPVLDALAASEDAVQLVSKSAHGAASNGPSYASAMTPDGRYVAFVSAGSNLVNDDTNGAPDAFVADRTSGLVERVDLTTDGRESAGVANTNVGISADGRFVTFASSASDLVTDDSNGLQDVFVFDREARSTARLSTGLAGIGANGPSSHPTISGDGRFVAFFSTASNLVIGDNNAAPDLFLFDRDAGTIARIDLGLTQTDSLPLSPPAVNADGSYVAFASPGSSVVSGDTNAREDLFVYRPAQNDVTRVSVGADGIQGDGESTAPQLSADGQRVVFASDASNLVPQDTNGVTDVFVHDLQTLVTTRVSGGLEGAQPNGRSDGPRISADGNFVAFRSDATNLVARDTNALGDVFVQSRDVGTPPRMVTSNEASVSADGPSIASGLSTDGRFVLLLSEAQNLVSGDSNRSSDLLLVDWSRIPTSLPPGSGGGASDSTGRNSGGGASTEPPPPSTSSGPNATSFGSLVSPSSTPTRPRRDRRAPRGPAVRSWASLARAFATDRQARAETAR